jgi:hypothetical protein
MAITKITIPATVSALTTSQYNAIQTNIDYILGIGEGDYGYGQTVASDQLEAGSTLTTSIYNVLAADILKARVHQTGANSSTLIPTLSSNATVTSAYIQKLVTQVNLAADSRLATPPVGANSTITQIGSQSTTEEWNNNTSHVIEVDFSTTENMRYFFNSGSQIQFLASRITSTPLPKSVSAPKNTSWTTLLKGIGTINFGRTKTTSTSKAGGTLIGYQHLFNADGTPTEGKIIFQKFATEVAYKLNSYTITAGISPNSDSAILFTIDFNDAASTAPELNIGGTLSSIVKAYRATGVNVEVPMPSALSNDLVLGLGAPTYTIERSALSISEIDTEGAVFEVITTNIDPETETLLYWTISGTKITEKDFDLDAMGVSSITNVPFIVSENTSGPISIIAAADAFKEGIEKFNFAVRTTNSLTATPVVQLPSLTLEKIDDTSLPVQVVPVTAFYFESQSVTSFKEGTAATFVIGAANMKTSTVVYWDLEYGDGDITKLDFANSAETGRFTFPSGRSTYTLSIKLTGKDGEDPGETFKVKIYTIVDGMNVYHDMSAKIAIIDDFVAAPVIPPPSIVITGNASAIEEGSAIGVEFTVSVPEMATGSKLYWVAKADSGTTELLDSDFSKTYVLGGVGKGGTASSYVTVNSNKKAVLKRFAAKDTSTEGTETFLVEFYSDPTYQNLVIGSSPISITETVGYTITSTPTSAVEGGATGIRFTVATPYMPYGKMWWTIALTSSLTGDDFESTSAQFEINDSVGYFDVYPKKDNVIEGDQLFQVDVRIDSAAGTIKASGKGTITEDLTAYSIDALTTVAEGGSVACTVTTPYTTSGKLYWSIQSATGIVTAADFTNTSNEISITNSSGSFTLFPKADNSTEGSESFKIVLRKNSPNGVIVYTQPEPIYITEIVEYTIGLQNGVTSLKEGGNVIVKITTPYTAPNTPLFWEIRPVKGDFKPTDITVVDYISTTRTSKLSGEVRTSLVTTNNITVSQASFSIYVETDAFTEGTEQFQIYLKDSSLGEPIKNTSVIDATELVPWTMLSYDPDTSAAITSVNEGSQIKFVVTTPYLPEKTALYWKAVSGGMGSSNFTTTAGGSQELEFTPMSGVIYTSNNSASVVVSPAADKFTEGSVNFKVRIYELPSTMSTTDINALTYTSVVSEGNFRIESYPIMINDTSETPPEPEVLPPKILTIYPQQNSQDVTSILEGTAFKYIVTTENIPTSQTLYWNLITVNVSSGEILPGTSGTFNVESDGTKILDFTSVGPSIYNGNKTVLLSVKLTSTAIKSTNGKPLTIIKEQQFTVTPFPQTVKEGDNVTFTITTPSSSANTNLKWRILPYADSNITAEDFIDIASGNPLSSISDITVPINAAGVGTVTLKTNTTLVEGREQFVMALAKEDGAVITLGVPCPPVTITEDVGYTIQASRSYMRENDSTEGSVTFTVNTPKMSQASTTLRYKVEQADGTIRNTDFVEFETFGPNDPLIKDFTVTKTGDTYSGTFTLTAREDSSAEGNDIDKFTIKLYTSSGAPIDATMTPTSISLREISTYSVSLTAPGVFTPAPLTVAEKTRVVFYVSTPQMDSGATLYWKAIPGNISTNITPADFSELSSGTTLEGYTYVFSNKTEIQLTPQIGNKSFTIQLSTVTPFAAVSATIPTVTVTQVQKYYVNGTPENLAEGGSVTFVIDHTAVPSNTMYWKLVGTSGAAIAATDFTYNGSDLTALSGTNTNMTAGGGQTSMVFGIKPDSITELKKGFTLQVGLSNSPFAAVTGGISNEITFTDAGSFALRADKTAVGKSTTVTFYLKVSATTTVKNIYWKIPQAYVSYFDPTTLSGTIAVSTKNSFDELPIVLKTAATFSTPITTDVSVTLEIKEETAAGAAITPTPNPSVNITGDYSISPNTATILENGTAITFTAPSSVNKIYWKLDNDAKKTWITGNVSSGERTRANGEFPPLQITPTAEGKNGKTFQISISDTNSGNPKLLSGEYTMPKAPVVTTDPGTGTVTPTIPTAPVLTIISNPLTISKGMTADFIVSTPTTTSVGINWVIKGDSTVLAALKGSDGKKISSGTSAASTSNVMPITKETGIGYFLLSITLAENVSGSFTIEFTPTGGVMVATEKCVAIGESLTYIFYNGGKLAIPAGITEVTVRMQGAGGQGGGMSNAFGGNGGNGDAITGTISIPDGAKELQFDMITGGAMYGTDVDPNMGPGGAGGKGVVLYIDTTYVATAAGGGGGGGGGPLPYPVMFPYTTPPGVEPVLHATSTTKSDTRTTVISQSAVGPGAGAGGYPGGISGIVTRSVQQQIYIKNDGTPTPATYDKCATGGSGGVSTIADAYKGSLTLIGPTSGIAPKSVTYTPTPTLHWKTPAWMNQYGIWGGATVSNFTARFDNVAINPTALTEYTLTVGCDDYGFITIDNVTTKIDGTRAKALTIKLNSSWNRTIVLYVKNKGTYTAPKVAGTTGSNPYGVAATIALKSAPTIILWSTRSPATVVSSEGQTGGGGQGGKGVAITTIPPGVTTIQPYTGGIAGVPRVNTGAMGDPAYISFTMTQTVNGVAPAGVKNYKVSDAKLNNKFIVPPGVSKISVIVIGGGGGGGTSYDAGDRYGAAGGGGGAGGVVICDISVQPNQEIIVSVGDGGAKSGGLVSTKSTAVANQRQGGKGGDSTLKIESFTITATGGTGGRGYNQDNTSSTAQRQNTTGGASGTGTVPPSGASNPIVSGSVVIPKINSGEHGTVDNATVDLATSKKTNLKYLSGGNGANNGTKHGQGGAGGSTFETTKLYAGEAGGDGLISIYWGDSISNYVAPPLKEIAATTKVVVPTKTAAVPSVPRPVSVVTYDEYTIGAGWEYFSYRYLSWIYTMYWEDLFIPVTPGMTIDVKFDDKGTATLTDGVGNTQIITQANLGGVITNVLPVQSVNQSLGVIVRIDLHYEDVGAITAGAHAVIKDSNGVILWHSRMPATHYT